MRKGSSKPCPGCGQVKSWRPASEVCTDCKRLLKRAAWLEEQVSRLGDDEIIVYYGSKPHWNEYISSQSNIGRDLMDSFFRLAEATTRPSLASDSTFGMLLGKVEYGGGKYTVTTVPIANAIRDLRDLVVKALKSEYLAGKKDGQNLLMQLANGDLSPDKFNQKSK
jgi:hypothetical protein